MTDTYILSRLDGLDQQVARLTQRVHHLETASVGRVPGVPDVEPEPVAPPPTPEPVVRLSPPPLAEAGASSGWEGARLAVAGAPQSPAPEAPAPVVSTEPAAPPTDWETLLGGNWLNKIGAFVLVVGIALALGYSFAHMGPWGRDAVGLTGAFAMLGVGVFYERRPRYQTFARGLIGGGWAALYSTVYAMQALTAAKVIDSPIAGAALLALVAAGMIAHALRFQSEAVVGVAYFSAFVALAITEVTAFSVVALIPLAASLLYIARRFHWSKLALFGLVATYVTCVSRGDTGAALWSTQALLAVYWLLFEGFDLLEPVAWLMPLNAVGFLSLSLSKWSAADPAHIWEFLAAAAIAYAVSGVLRARLQPHAEPLSGGWHGPATVTAGLAAAAILRQLENQWVLAALLAEGELFYLCGLRFRVEYLRWLAIPLFGLQLTHLAAAEAPHLPVKDWVPVAAITALVFYGNRALRAADTFYGYAAAAVAALIGGFEAPARECGQVWFLLALGPFFVGWWRRLADFRFQGYLLACLAAAGTVITAPHPPLSTAIGAAASYALAAFALWSAEDRFLEGERSMLFTITSTAGAVSLAIVLLAVLPHWAIGPAWAAEALMLVCAGLLVNRSALRWQSCAVAAAAIAGCWTVNLYSHDTTLAAAAAVVCFYAAQLLSKRGDDHRLYYSLLGTALTTGTLYYEVSGSVLTVACGAQGLALLGTGFPLRDRTLRISGLALLLACILKLFIYDLSYLDTLPRIFSFIVLGLILIGVSWIYTRFRDKVQKFL